MAVLLVAAGYESAAGSPAFWSRLVERGRSIVGRSATAAGDPGEANGSGSDGGTPSGAAGSPGGSTPGKADQWIDASSSPFPVRGIVEGFYGAPWTDQARLSMFDFMARAGMNTYVYAPKDDDYQRTKWRDLYPAPEVSEFQTLIGRARKDGVDFVYSISPGLDVIYCGRADREALAAKIDQLRELGVDTIMLSLDDIPEKMTPADSQAYHGDFAAAQADLANWVYQTERAKDSGFRLWVTPTHYWGTKADPYLTVLGKQLDPRIALLWTGRWVLAGEITAADADGFAAATGRKPIVWDNYPVNDYTYVQDKGPVLLLGPLRGRAPDLASHVSGFLANPMLQEEASKLPLYTTADYLSDPRSYDAEVSWQKAASHLANSADDASTLLEFASYAERSLLDDRDPAALARAIGAYRSGAAGSKAQLAALFTGMVSLRERLAGAAPAAFCAEVQPWATALGQQGRAGLLALDLDAAAKAKDLKAVQADLLEAKSALVNLQAADSAALIAGHVVEQFVKDSISRSDAPGNP